MDRRFDERYPANLKAKVTTLEKEDVSALGQLADISKSGVCLMIPIQLGPGDMVLLEIGDSMLYGHVAYSSPDEQLFRTGIEVYRVVLGGTDLSHILQTILRREMPHIPGVERPELYLG